MTLSDLVGDPSEMCFPPVARYPFSHLGMIGSIYIEWPLADHPDNAGGRDEKGWGKAFANFQSPIDQKLSSKMSQDNAIG